MHFEIPIDEPDRASTFYRNVFGWNVAKWSPVDYWTMTTEAAPGPGAGGGLTRRGAAPEGSWCTSAWTTSTTRRAASRTLRNMLTEKRSSPTMGWASRPVPERSEDHLQKSKGGRGRRVPPGRDPARSPLGVGEVPSHSCSATVSLSAMSRKSSMLGSRVRVMRSTRSRKSLAVEMIRAGSLVRA